MWIQRSKIEISLGYSPTVVEKIAGEELLKPNKDYIN
ncbi:hypothetical protein V6Z11_A05G271400 [Gossypium hirsutum]